VQTPPAPPPLRRSTRSNLGVMPKRFGDYIMSHLLS
jgi:hypothetical protein